ncbi:efflux RND transporter periplasmic adaptor subunit [Caenimonas sedimenti]|uniref:Efflux RND transporter periplasmic adaptor subunit n=1 Tax=Caenimonas sedimenti TaxID=2596921 RepID=A0A562ZTZ3_9BURK|nr:efflux RND transporter periplasmic adaptor subunit [Caenimonas sedimenti]TWO71953.1 efflux RND transporter periplasmic adaptor subunit [Caenimonas sedimenti]
MASKAIYTVVAVVGIAAASGVAWWVQNKPAGQAAPGADRPAAGASAPGGTAARPPAVEVARVEQARITDDAQTVGSLRSRQNVMLRPEVSGRVTELNFRDGERVRKGQLLVQLDDQLPRAQIQQAQAELSIARANHKRNQELVAQNFIAQRAVDESAANLQVADAKLALAQATAARLRILAPFDGVAGIRTVSVGDYLKDGADIVNIEDLEAIYVDFRMPERFQAKIRRGQRAVVNIDSLPGRRYVAQVQAIDPLVDANGRSIGIRGCIDNRQLQLRPGMFARITTVFGERENALLIPEESLVPQGGRQFVLKVVDGPDKDTRIARRIEVKVGIRRPGKVEVLEGLQAGDMVVTAGQQRVQRDGMPVRIVELNRPAAEMREGAGGGGAGGAGAAGAVRPASAPADGTRPMAPASAPAPAMAQAAPSAPRGPQGAGGGARPQATGPDPCVVAAADTPRPQRGARPAGG